MFGSTFEATSTSVLERYDGLISELHNLTLTCATGEEVLEFLQELETRNRQLATADHQLIAEIGSRGLAREHACKDTATLLTQLLRISSGEASSRVRAAADMGPRLGMTGEVLPPVFARVAAAQAAGSISAAHARIVTGTVDALPAAVQADHDQSVETFLVEQAQVFDPKLLASVAHRLRSTLDQDGILADEAHRHRRRDLRITRRRDGSSYLQGELTAICTEALFTVLDTLMGVTGPTA